MSDHIVEVTTRDSFAEAIGLGFQVIEIHTGQQGERGKPGPASTVPGPKGDQGDLAPVTTGLSWSGAVTVDVSGPAVLHATLTGDAVVSLPTPASSHAHTVSLILTQAGEGGHEVAFTGAVAAWGVPLEARGPGEVSLIHCMWDGTRYWVLDGAQNASVPAGWV